jgi:hypothetical protein
MAVGDEDTSLSWVTTEPERRTTWVDWAMIALLASTVVGMLLFSAWAIAEVVYG